MYYLRQAVETLIGSYDGKLPLSHHLKQHFKAHPKLGSRDRRAISDAIYTYYRFARFVMPSSGQHIWDIVREGVLQCGIENPFLQRVLDGMEANPVQWDITAPFPGIQLTSGMEADTWKKAMLQQPRLFLRLRHNRERTFQLLQQQEISYTLPDEQAISLPNSTQIDKLLDPKDYVVQDYSSQHSMDLLKQHADADQKAIKVWDTCAGAGGKMLLLKDTYPEATILSTDIRPTILHNLKERARLYGHKFVQTKVVDSSDAGAVSGEIQGEYDWVISDVPCSGSGTWARTPEQFYFFHPDKLLHFADLQWSIARNTCRKVKPGGYFLYITCSVFTAENEAVVQRLLQTNPDMELVAEQLLNGVDMQADSMYAALIQRKP